MLHINVELEGFPNHDSRGFCASTPHYAQLHINATSSALKKSTPRSRAGNSVDLRLISKEFQYSMSEFMKIYVAIPEKVLFLRRGY